MVKAIVVHRRDENNVGDYASDPLQYFLKPKEYKRIDITNIGREHLDDSMPVIAGGGGLIANELFVDSLRDIVQPSDKTQLLNIADQYWTAYNNSNKHIRDEFFNKLNKLVGDYADKISDKIGPRILWGAGHNGHYEKKFKGKLEYPRWLKQFDEIGIRDWNQQYQWLPCASCMHPALQRKHEIKNEVIWFEHKKQFLKGTEFGTDPIPRFINSGNNIDQTISILGSAEIVITNSYHGAYWGTLLGKRVIVAEAWSSKFNAMRHMPYYLAKGEYWKDIVDEVPVYSNALQECIATTESFWNNKVKGYLS